jgi:hypothetical protein
MDRRAFRSNSCNGAGGKGLAAAPFSVSRTSSAPAAPGSKEDAVGEHKALLPPRRPPGGTARKGQKGPKRRVQWKDTHGKKLVEVLEFQPR